MSESMDELTKRILGLLQAYPGGLSFTDIVRLTGKPKETVNKRLKSLVSAGFVVKRREGRKVIYQLAEDHMNFMLKLLKQKFIEEAVFLDHLKAFTDLLAEGRAEEAFAVLCSLWYFLGGFIAGQAHELIEIIQEEARKMLLEENLSFTELRERINNMTRIISFTGVEHLFRVANLLPVAAGKAVVESLIRGKQIEISKEKLLSICRSEDELEKLVDRALEFLRNTSYGKRLAELRMELRKNSEKEPSPIDVWNIVARIYEKVGEEIMTKSLRFPS